MELTLVYTIIGFGLAGWSVIANDSIQTLGTFIASKKKIWSKKVMKFPGLLKKLSQLNFICIFFLIDKSFK